MERKSEGGELVSWKGRGNEKSLLKGKREGGELVSWKGRVKEESDMGSSRRKEA